MSYSRYKRNPPLAKDMAAYIIPGFAAFAASRVFARMATEQIAKRRPGAGRHAGAIAAVGAFAAAWFGAHRVKYLARYHDGIVVGSGLAAIQSLISIYMPRLARSISGEARASAIAAPVSIPRVQNLPPPSAVAPSVPAGFKPTTANEWYAYNDSFDAGGYKGAVEIPSGQSTPAPTMDAEEQSVSDLLDNSDLNLDNADLDLDSDVQEYS